MKYSIVFIFIFFTVSTYCKEKMNGSVLLKDIPIGSKFTFDGELIRKAKRVCDKERSFSSFVDGKLVCVTNSHSFIERRFLLNGIPPDNKSLNCSLVAIKRKENDAIKLVFDGSCNFFSITVARADLDNLFTNRNAGEIEANSFNYNLGSFGKVHFDDFDMKSHRVSNTERTPSLEKIKDTIEDLTPKTLKE